MTATRLTGDGHEIDLWLDDLEHLFVAPPIDLFSEYRSHLSGIDFLINELGPMSLKQPVRTTIHLPAEAVTPGIEEAVQRGVHRYCEQRVNYNANAIKAHHRDGWSALVQGVIVLFLGLALSEFTRRVPGPEVVTVFFADGVFLVAAWVALWYPLDVLVFGTRALRRENKVLRVIQGMDVRVVAQSATP